MLRGLSVGRGVGRRLASGEVARSGPSGLAVAAAEVKLTRLPNQMMVTSVQTEDVAGSAVAVAFRAGSRYETPASQGASQRIALMAGLGAGLDSKLGTSFKLAKAGVVLDVNQNRDLIVFTANTTPDKRKDALKAMADVVADPGFRQWELWESQETLVIQAQKRAADPRNVLDDLVHKVAFRGQGLGAPLYARDGAVGGSGSAADKDALKTYFQNNFVSGSTALLGVNLDHDYLLDYSADALPVAEAKGAAPAGQGYAGGEEHQHWGGDVSRAVWAAEGASWQDVKGLATQAVLVQQLVGDVSVPWAGSAHGSVAGPALSQAIGSSNFTLQPYTAPHSDAGLVGFYLATKKADLEKGLKAVLGALKGLSSSAGDIEGAKKRAALELLSESEESGCLVQMSLAQVLSGPNFATPADMGDAIAAVSAQDVQALAQKLLKGKASLASLGDLAHSPRLDAL